MRFFAMALLLAASLQNIPGCGAGKGEMTPQEESASAVSMQTGLQKIYVELAESTTIAAAGEETVLNVIGNLPSPAYKLERVEVKVEGNVIELTPLASQDRDKMVAQVLVPFTKTVKVRLPRAGEYIIRVVGRSENRESKIMVK